MQIKFKAYTQAIKLVCLQRDIKDFTLIDYWGYVDTFVDNWGKTDK